MTQSTIKVVLTAELGCCKMDFHKTKELSAHQIIHMFCLYVPTFNWRIVTTLCGFLPSVNVDQPQEYTCLLPLKLPPTPLGHHRALVWVLWVCIFGFLSVEFVEQKRRLQVGAVVFAASEQWRDTCMPSGGMHPPSQSWQTCGSGQQGSCRIDPVCLHFLNCARRAL